MEKLEFLPQDKVIWGRQALSDTMATLGRHGFSRPIVFTVEPLEGLYRRFIEPFLPDQVGTYLDLPPHVPDFAVEGGLKACVARGAGSIVALGGGSVLDAAKAVSHFHKIKHGRFLPIVALPTTLSGSEFSHYFGVTETTEPVKFKRSYAVRETAPKLVVIDPELVRGTPRGLLLSSAVKGLDHAIEGMRLVGADHPHGILAASGVRRFLGVLSRWPERASTEEALVAGAVTLDDLLQLQLAAWQCYFFPASVIYGLSHRIGHILGGTFGVPHSMTSCITLAPVVRACAGFYGDKLRIFSEPQAQHPAAALAGEIATTVKRLGLPTRLRDLGLERYQLPTLLALLVENYPEEVKDLGDGAEEKLFELVQGIW
ncbi:iron-containing alcohol dehydrogenase [Rhizobium sp. CECT 9324]|uniref:iron-containing alcohol dehydrogenase n=1 Tax=Rhizobium sp. CECT 9324 TaxID=2845820 RepID=UPI001E2E5B59|nr:iron-containing alcohol dehydrogenase [Rhizobium sp. CECT 9324]CAH0340850.1 hypothetical protein RHI9324_02532 [Rhizobium sp. CECT 9324]